MNPNEDIKISVNISKPTIRNKYFIHNNNKYPINFDLLKQNSNYFYINRKQYKNSENIELLTESEKQLNITEESIEAFISSCQNKSYQISLSSIIPLQYLAHKFDFPELLRITTEAIDSHYAELVIQKLIFHADQLYTHPFFDIKRDEQYIIDNFSTYINDDQLLSLPFSTIDRILLSYSKLKGENQQESPEITQFLFKCLDKYGSKASVLFNYFNFEKDSRKIRDRLLQNYSELFNFNLLDSSLDKTASEIVGDLEKEKENFLSTFSEKTNEFDQKCSELNKLREEISATQKEEERKNDELKTKLDSDVKESLNNIENRFKFIEEKFQEMCKAQDNFNNDEINQYYLRVLNEMSNTE